MIRIFPIEGFDMKTTSNYDNQDSAMRLTIAKSRHDKTACRRGSVLVLVAGILVLLLVVAFAYLSRTKSERVTSVAHQTNSRELDRATAVRDDLAREIAEHLFPRPFDPTQVDTFVPPPPLVPALEDPNEARYPIDPTSRRYSIADSFDNIAGTYLLGGDGVPDFWWNVAPHSVKPWTNWPDTYIEPDLFNPQRKRSDDILGNPGTNDTRWLASTEPLRWIFDTTGLFNRSAAHAGDDTLFDTPDIVEYFSHWQHMSNISRPGNGYIIVTDISNVTRNAGRWDGAGLSNGPYGTPFEQWLPATAATLNAAGTPTEPGFFLPDTFNRVTGRNVYNAATFGTQWENWFTNHGNAMLGPFIGGAPGIPGNYYDFGDLNGNGIPLEFGERPEDEFIDGTARHEVSRILADADGDGFSDSFWFLAPSAMESDIRSLVAVRIIDSSAMLNVNVATEFVRGFPNLGGTGPVNHGTRGHTPSDLAMYEYATEGLFGAGFLNNPEHSEVWFPDGGLPNNNADSPFGTTEAAFRDASWQAGQGTILGELVSTPGFTDLFYRNPFNRLDYWRRAGSRPFDSAAPTPSMAPGYTNTYTPFTIQDEAELRRFHATNSPWAMSRLERAFQTSSNTNSLLRATLGREETSEYLDALRVRTVGSGYNFDEPLHDVRRQITTFSTARNGEMPAWLWWQYRWALPTVLNAGARQTFTQLTQTKLDLRDRDNRVGSITDPNNGIRTFVRRLVPTLTLALTDGEDTGATPNAFYYNGFSGGATEDLQRTRELAAAYAANILAYRDNDDDDINDNIPVDGRVDVNSDGIADASVAAPLFIHPSPPPGFQHPYAVGAVQVATDIGEIPSTSSEYFLGMEAQPFLLEVFIAHVHEPTGVVTIASAPGNLGQNYVDDTADSTTVVAIQIANPFERMINLRDYKLRVFGQEIDLDTILGPGTPDLLGPATEEEPRTAIIYSIPTTFSGNASFRSEFLDFFDIQSTDLYPGSFVLDATAQLSNDKLDYDSVNGEAVELIRVTPDANWTGTIDVVVDRIDNPNDPDATQQDRFGDAVTSLVNDPEFMPPPADPPTQAGILIENDDYYVVWARTARLWGDDLNNDSILQDNERGPRFVFTSHYEGFTENSDVDAPTETQDTNGMVPGGVVYLGDRWAAGDDPDMMATAWIERAYVDPNNVNHDGMTLPARKPTFFPCYTAYDLAGNPQYGPMPVPLRWGPNINLADKGVKASDDYFYPHPLQMNLKNGDFEQVGELLNVFMFGHRVTLPGGNTYGGTEQTFSEYMSSPLLVGEPDTGRTGVYVRTNRIKTLPEEVTLGAETVVAGAILGQPRTLADYTTLSPSLPAGQRLLSAFVCNDHGYNTDRNDDGFVDYSSGTFEEFRFLNAPPFDTRFARGTPGMVNINTATREVMRALPHGFRLVHESNFDQNATYDYIDPAGTLRPPYPHLDPSAGEYSAGRTRLAEAIETYRARLGAPFVNPGLEDPLPDYGGRGLQNTATPPPFVELNFSRGDYGFESIGEITALLRPGRVAVSGNPVNAQWNRSWQVDVAATDHLRSVFGGDTDIDVDLSVDVMDRYDPATTSFLPDETAQDDEEASLLFNAMSNIITTRSDSFIVYFKIRNVRVNPVTGIWDATDPEFIVDESRYMMIVDRSNVDRPTDSPRILLYEKVPD